MDIFCIRGGTPLHGRIALHGAKNAALPLLAATLATGARCELLDCPDISDVTAACAILRHLGCAVEQHGGIVAVDAGSACRSDIPAELMRKMRAAVLFLGPLLARFGTAELSLPGGCVLGARPIDLHLRGLRRMGAEITASIFRPGPTAFTAARSRCRFQASAQRRISSLRRSAAGAR